MTVLGKNATGKILVLNHSPFKVKHNLHHHDFNFYLKIVLICIGIFEFFHCGLFYLCCVEMPDFKARTIIRNQGFMLGTPKLIVLQFRKALGRILAHPASSGISFTNVLYSGGVF